MLLWIHCTKWRRFKKLESGSSQARARICCCIVVLSPLLILTELSQLARSDNHGVMHAVSSALADVPSGNPCSMELPNGSLSQEQRTKVSSTTFGWPSDDRVGLCRCRQLTSALSYYGI